MNYRINYLLLEQLPKLYPYGIIAFYRDSGIPRSTWDNWVDTKGYRIMRIVELCNALSIPFEYLISKEENTDIIPSNNELFRDESEFDEVKFNIKLFAHTITGERCIKKLASITGIGRTTLYKWLRNKENSDMTVECFVHACNILNCEFSNFISVQDNDKRVTAEIDKLKSHNRKLSTKVKKLSDENEQLKKDKDRLLALIEKHVAFASYPTMVADDGNSNYNV